MELLGVTLSTLDTKDKDLQFVFHDKKEAPADAIWQKVWNQDEASKAV